MLGYTYVVLDTTSCQLPRPRAIKKTGPGLSTGVDLSVYLLMEGDLNSLNMYDVSVVPVSAISQTQVGRSVCIIHPKPVCLCKFYVFS